MAVKISIWINLKVTEKLKISIKVKHPHPNQKQFVELLRADSLEISIYIKLKATLDMSTYINLNVTVTQ